MDIAFFDATDIDYNVDTPLTKPLSGSQSALCYLAVALARLGHRIFLVNRTASPGMYSGVQSIGLTDEGLKCLQTSDIVIVQNGAAGQALRENHLVKSPLVLWAHHAPDQPAMQNLQNPREREAWNGFVFVSQWALNNYVRHFGIPAERSRVFHNGIAPVFAQQEATAPWYETGAAPVLAYTSTPFRGLDILLDAFPAIRAAVPDAQLRVYSSMSIYGAADDPGHRVLYDRCRQMPGATYMTPVPQTQLAREIAGIAALAYPSTFPETFCIAAAEALSAGALLLTTKLGALPEIFGELALMIAPDADRQRFANTFAAHVVNALENVRRDPGAAAARRKSQIEFIKSTYVWPAIAPQWAVWLQQIAGKM